MSRDQTDQQSTSRPSWLDGGIEALEMVKADMSAAEPVAVEVESKPIRRAVTNWFREVSAGGDQPSWECFLSCGHTAVARGVKGFKPRSARCYECEALRVKPQAQDSANEGSEPVPAPISRPELRLLCLLVKDRDGKARSLPVHTMRPMPPRVLRVGRWSLASDPALHLRETRAERPSPEVLARYSRQRQTNALRTYRQDVRSGALSP